LVAAKYRDATYDRITHVLGVLRKAGNLGWDMVLDLTRELDEWQIYESPREARAALRRRYDEDRWVGQPFYPIFIVEKALWSQCVDPWLWGGKCPLHHPAAMAHSRCNTTLP
jgi:hypothetical protein